MGADARCQRVGKPAGTGCVGGSFEYSRLMQRRGGVAQAGVQETEAVEPEVGVNARVRAGMPHLSGRLQWVPPADCFPDRHDLAPGERQKRERGEEGAQLQRRYRIEPGREGELGPGPAPLPMGQRGLREHPMAKAL
jgi:hypothetical protein